MDPGKFFAGFPLVAQFGAMVCLAVLAFVFLSNHQIVDSLVNLFKAFPLVVFIPIRMGIGQPGEEKATPGSQEKLRV